MGLFRRSVVVALALAAACSSKGGSGGNAGSSGSSEGDVRSADGVVASVAKGKLEVRTQDGRTLAFPMKDDTKVTLGGGEASSAVVTEGAPVRVSFKGSDTSPVVVSVDVEPKIHAGNTGQPPAAGKYEANGGNEGDAHARPPQAQPQR
jgi:hypothetical protein